MFDAKWTNNAEEIAAVTGGFFLPAVRVVSESFTAEIGVFCQNLTSPYLRTYLNTSQTPVFKGLNDNKTKPSEGSALSS